LLLPKETVIGTFVNKREADRYAEANNGDASDPVKIAAFSQRKYRTIEGKTAPFAGKLAVLINRGSASASEICAAALKEISGAPIVGGRSAGAVLASVYGRLPHGFEIQYPITDYVTAKGIRLEGNPLVPDYESPTVVVGDKDDALEKAISVLKNKP
jgi:carboxyl-terminal processing protease